MLYGTMESIVAQEAVKDKFVKSACKMNCNRLSLKCDGTRAEIRFRLSAKRTSPFKSAEASVQSTTGSRGYASAVVMLNTPCSEIVWRVLATHSIRQFPLHFPSRASLCTITFQLDSTYYVIQNAASIWDNVRAFTQFDTAFHFGQKSQQTKNILQSKYQPYKYSYRDNPAATQYGKPVALLFCGSIHSNLTLILRHSRTGTVWFYTSISNKRAARPKLYTKSLTRDLKRMYSRLTLVRISIKL